MKSATLLVLLLPAATPVSPAPLQLQGQRLMLRTTTDGHLVAVPNGA